MPNWCSNYLRVAVTEETPEAKAQLADFYGKVQAAKGNEDILGLFSVFLPCPKELYDGSGWYDWCVQNWGTKWDVALHVDSLTEWDVNESSDTEKVFTFDTAWAPPVEFCITLSEMYPLLEIKNAFSECGSAFAGFNVYVNGEETDSLEFETDWVYAEDDEALENPEPSEEWAQFMEEYSLHTGG